MAKDINLTSRKWNDIIFEGKPKDYGAYEMRESSSRRHVYAFIAVVVFVVLVALIPTVIETVEKMRPVTENIDTDTTLADLKAMEELEQQEDIVKEFTEIERPPLKSTIAFVAPEIVDDEDIDEDQRLKTQDELQASKTTISYFNVEGEDEEIGVDAAELEEQQRLAEEVADNMVYDDVEQMPEFPGGVAELRKYLGRNLKYPKAAEENGIAGTVKVRYTVSRDGSITNVIVVLRVDPDLDAEAVRLIKGMPKWIPGKSNGRAVNVNYELPIVFQLN